LRLGVQLLWVVEPRHEQMTVHRPERPPPILIVAEDLDGEKVLPGLRPSQAELVVSS